MVLFHNAGSASLRARTTAAMQRLRRAIPGWLLEPGLGMRRAAKLNLSAAQFRNPGAMSTALPKLVDIELDPEVALQRQLELPKAALSMADEAASVRLRQTLPAHGRDMVWRIGKPVVRGGEAHVRAFVVKQSKLSHLVRSLSERGVVVRTIGLSGHGTLTPFWDDRRRLNKGSKTWLVLAIALPLAVTMTYVYQIWSESEALNERRLMIDASLRSATEDAATLQRNVKANEKYSAVLANALANMDRDQRRTATLRNLTDVLGDDTWISEFNVHGDRFRAAGFSSGDIVQLIDKIQSEPWVSTVRLEGAITYDPISQNNRFEIMVTMNPSR